VRFLLFIITCLLVVSSVFSQGLQVVDSTGENLTSKSTYKQNLSSEDALEAALLYTGFGKQKELRQRLSASATMESTIAVDSTTPFLSDQITGRESWIVKFPSVDLAQQLNSKKTFPPKDVEILFDKKTGQILKMVGKSVELDTNIFRLPTAYEAELQLASFFEKYLGIPEDPPQKDLIEILSVCYHICSSYDFIASYVTYQYQGREPIPAWSVYVRSSRPICGVHYAPEEIYKVSNERTMINAITGKCIFSGNLPYPLLEGGFGIDKENNKKEGNLKEGK